MTQTQITLTKLNKMKQHGEKIAMLTAYDATFARLQYEAGVDVVLVGDSLGMVLQGCASTLPVTVEDMVYHVGCVARGAPQAFIMADMPFMSGVLLSDTVANARKLMQVGAHMVKLEGGLWLGELIQTLSRGGIPVCAHLGLTPQSVNQLGGYKVQGKDPRQAEALISCAKSLEAQGAAMLLLECVPADLARRISQSVQLPVIGIGAGVDCDGQVLVMHDMLGANPHPARFVQNFLEQQNSLSGAFQAYVRAVKSKTFPAPEQSYFF